MNKTAMKKTRLANYPPLVIPAQLLRVFLGIAVIRR